MIQTTLSYLLHGSSYFARVTFGGDLPHANLLFGSEEYPDAANDLGLDDLNSLIHMLSVARDELEASEPANKETE